MGELPGSELPISEWLDEFQQKIQRDTWDTRVEVSSCFEAKGFDFKLTVRCRAFENDKLIFSRGWSENVPRMLAPPYNAEGDKP